MLKLNVGHIIEALSGLELRPASMQTISDVVIDSRAAAPGTMFVAFVGESVDGHDYVVDAFERGAVVALIERPVPAIGDHCRLLDLRRSLDLAGADLALPLCLLVDDTQVALQQIASFWRLRHKPRVIGITGSVGKTTTKELIHAVLGTRYRSLKSPGNLNNEIGLPLTLTHLTDRHDYLVLEMGMYDRGEIAALATIARPQIGVVTNIGPVHMERLGSIKAIADAKAELVEALPPAPEGVAILNYDEPLVRAMAERTEARIFTYGLNPKADLWANNIEGAGLEGIRFSLHYRNETIHVRAPLLGRHSVHTALRATAVGLVEGMGWGDIVSGLQGDSPQLRLVAVHGPRGSLVLDDTYNASPASTIAALNLLAEIALPGAAEYGGRRVAVLGDMLELGAYELEGHRLVGRRAADVADLLISVGSLGQIIAEEALAAGLPPERVSILSDVDEAIEMVPDMIRACDTLLIKGSRGIALNRLVDVLSRGRISPADQEAH